MAKQIEPGVMCMCLVCPSFYFQFLGSWGTAKSWGRGIFDLMPLYALLGKTAILSGFLRSSLRGLQRTFKPNPWLSPGWFEATSQKNWERQRERDTGCWEGSSAIFPPVVGSYTTLHWSWPLFSKKLPFFTWFQCEWLGSYFWHLTFLCPARGGTTPRTCMQKTLICLKSIAESSKSLGIS